MAIFHHSLQQSEHETCHTSPLNSSLAHDIEHLLTRLSRLLTNRTRSKVKITMALSPTSPASPVSPNTFSVSATSSSSCTEDLLYNALEETMSTPSQNTPRFSSIRSPTNRSSLKLPTLSTDRSFAERMHARRAPPQSSCSRRNSVTEYKMTLSDNENDDIEPCATQGRANSDNSTYSEYVDAACQSISDTELVSAHVEALMRYTDRDDLDFLPRCENLSSTHSSQHQNTATENAPQHSTIESQQNLLYRSDDGLSCHSRSSECHSSRCMSGELSMAGHDYQPRSSATLHPRPTVHLEPILSKPLSSYPSEVYVPSRNTTHLQRSIAHLATALVPLISVTTGQPHPEFPSSLLQYHLLTHDQLDSLARWYHQTIDGGRERWMYPSWIRRPWTMSQEQSMTREQADAEDEIITELTAKRRRFGRFIGLRGCESPTTTGSFENMVEDEAMQDQETEDRNEAEDDFAARLEREWKAALRRAEEEEKLEEKIWKRRW